MHKVLRPAILNETKKELKTFFQHEALYEHDLGWAEMYAEEPKSGSKWREFSQVLILRDGYKQYYRWNVYLTNRQLARQAKRILEQNL